MRAKSYTILFQEFPKQEQITYNNSNLKDTLKTRNMVNQLKCLRAGGLVLGIVGTIVALMNFFYAIAIYEDFSIASHNFVLAAIIGDAPEHIIRLTYVTISIFDLVAAALLIAGILMVNIANNCSIISNSYNKWQWQERYK